MELLRGAWVDLAEDWVDEVDAVFERLKAELQWEQRPIRVFGKEQMQPRLIGWAGELGYKYSGQTLEPRAWTPTVRALTERVSALTGTAFNHVLLNRYRDGMDMMGKHADNEPELGKDPLIAAISLGASRPFVLWPKDKRAKKSDKKTIRLEHGQLLVMGGNIQHTYRHGVPRVSGLREERINLTFRLLRGPPGWRGD